MTMKDDALWGALREVNDPEFLIAWCQRIGIE